MRESGCGGGTGRGRRIRHRGLWRAAAVIPHRVVRPHCSWKGESAKAVPKDNPHLRAFIDEVFLDRTLCKPDNLIGEYRLGFPVSKNWGCGMEI